VFSISHIDHIVLTVKDIPTSIEFYARVLGMHTIQFGDLNNQTPRIALKFGNQKINLHECGKEFEPSAHKAVPGSADLCLITEGDISKAMEYVLACKLILLKAP